MGHLHGVGRRRRRQDGDREDSRGVLSPLEVRSERDGGDDLAADALQPSHAWPHLRDK